MRLLPHFVSDAWRGIRAGRELRSTSSLEDPSPSLAAFFGSILSKSGASVSESTALNVSVVRACVDLRALLVAMLPLKVFKRTATGPEEQRDHPLSRLLRGRVNDRLTSFRWRYLMQACHDLGGNAYSRPIRGQGYAIERIRWLKPGDVTALHNPVTDAAAYDVRISGAPVERLASHDMLHVANLSSNGVTGRSPLSDLRESIGLALTSEEFAARSFANGNRMPGVIVGKDSMTPAKAKEFVDFFQREYTGVQNASKTPLMWGVDWKAAGMSNHDAELILTRKFSVEEIARVYHLPLHLIGSTDKATTWGSGIEQLNRGLVDYTLAPLCANWEAELNTTLLSEQEQDEGYYIKFVLDALLRGSLETRAKVYQIMRGIAAMDVNQIRRLEEWPEYPDGWAGDPRLPMNNQGGGGKPAPEAEPANANEE